MLKRLLILLIIVPIAIIVIWLAVNNRQLIQVFIPPDVGGEPLFSFQVPLFIAFFATLLVGILIGSFTTWLKQGKHRKAARVRKAEATKWHFEADKEKERANELAQKVASADSSPAARGLPSPSKAA
ncbi:LapA family protein [Pseudahrensia aquimaris]|uniref:LapA family protein n=1 Tax=Pseudahrensia aquimaris TaxID=744461 RepID=A0ABW3FH53_9HYPH